MRFFLLVPAAVLWAASLFAEPRHVEVYTYHTHAPFIIDDEHGLTYDLAGYLTEKSNGVYDFTVLAMTRARIDKILEEKVEGIIPWVSPDWFSDKTLLWTRGELMLDGNTVISSMDLKLDYSGPESVKGLRFGGVRGHHYVDIDPLVEAGEIRRFDNENHLNNFRMIEKGRIDFTIAPLAASQYLIKSNNMEETLYLSGELHSSYYRRIIVSGSDEELRRFLDTVLARIQSDPKWQLYVNRYK